MRQHFLIIVFFVATLASIAQSKGVRIGYIDMDYILENVPDYKEASLQLEEKAQGWKQEIEIKKNQINKIREDLKIEKALLTKELIVEREDEIKFLENELLDYQQKRFGPRGDLSIQKASIVKPVQDQVFNAVQDIAEAKSYDFIFDKSSDMTMLFSAKRYDVSDQVVRIITRAEKKEEMSKKQRKAQEEKESKEDEKDENPDLAERKRVLEQKKAERTKLLEEKKLSAEQKKKEFEEKRKKLLEAQQAKKAGKTVVDTTAVKPNSDGLEKQKMAQDSLKSSKEKARLELLEKNKKAFEERKKALEDKRQKALDEREAIRKAKEEELKKKNENKK
jgi:Skp family chaperone for outer membrane proteins